MEKKENGFNELMQLYNHIAEEEKHFNNLELEYRKLTSHWLLASLGSIGFILTKSDVIPINIWILIIGICCAAIVGILIIWLLDIKVYHELLHAAFSQGVALEKKYPEVFPQIRNKMLHSQIGGDIIKRVILFYFFSVLVLIVLANISIWMMKLSNTTIPILFNVSSFIVTLLIYKILNHKSTRNL